MKIKKLVWEWVEWYGNPSIGNAWRTKVGSGFLWLHPWDVSRGVTYTSSFGPNSDKSFTGFLPKLTMDEAKNAVLSDAASYWNWPASRTKEDKERIEASLEEYRASRKRR